tara:strand:- start:326 stop:550 length:225 start_codon:yes stop_codon:yes gene_type:complete
MPIENQPEHSTGDLCSLRDDKVTRDEARAFLVAEVMERAAEREKRNSRLPSLPFLGHWLGAAKSIEPRIFACFL